MGEKTNSGLCGCFNSNNNCNQRGWGGSKKKRNKLDYKKLVVQSAIKSTVASVSPRTLWGQLIIKLRESHSVALHIACGDITDVDYNGETFFINTTDAFLYELLKSEDNMKDLKNAFESFGIKKFEIRTCKKSPRPSCQTAKYVIY